MKIKRLRRSDVRIMENLNQYLLRIGGEKIRDFNKRAWTHSEVVAWRDGYVWGRNDEREAHEREAA